MNGNRLDRLPIRPAGMTYKRALEIAMSVEAKKVRTLGFLEPEPTARIVPYRKGYVVKSSRSPGSNLTDWDRQHIISLRSQGQTVNQIALAMGVSSRTVERTCAAKPEPIDTDWLAEQQRLANLETFRHQTETDAA